MANEAPDPGLPSGPAEASECAAGSLTEPSRTTLLARATACLCKGLLVALFGFASALHAQPDAARLVPVCIACHGPNGVSASPDIPSLAGQNELYLSETLVELKTLVTPSVIMKGITHDISVDDLKALAAYFARQAYVRNPQPVDPVKVERGRKVVGSVCRNCHVDFGRTSTYSDYPLLAGQSLNYMLREVGHILARRRGVDDIKLGMIDRLAPEQIEDAVHFFASQHESLDVARIGTSLTALPPKSGANGK